MQSRPLAPSPWKDIAVTNLSSGQSPTRSPASPLPPPPPIRSLLFVPGHRGDRIEKALASPADAIAIDLESATPPGELERARELARRAIETHHARWRHDEDVAWPRPSILVRVAAAGSADQARDLDAVVAPGLTGILLPQVVDASEVVATSDALADRERAAGLPVGRIRVMPLVESANAVRTAYEIAGASPRVAYMGGATSRGGDLARSLGYRFTDSGRETLFLRSKVLIDVRAAGVPNPLSGLWGRIDDLEGLRVLACESRELGYEGFLTIHPKQVAIVNAIFSPSREEIDDWQRILEAMEAAWSRGEGAIRVGDRLVDEAHAKTARQQLERAHRLGIV